MMHLHHPTLNFNGAKVYHTTFGKDGTSERDPSATNRHNPGVKVTASRL